MNTQQARKAESLRQRAAALDSQIEAKLHPAIASQNPTRRRLHIAEGMEREGRNLQRTQRVMLTLADMHEAGTVPPVLAKLRFAVEIQRARYSSQADEREALAELWDATERPPTDAERIRTAERALIGRKIPGFFPSPRPVVERLLELAEIGAGDWVLEPSAGAGAIADVIREKHPDNQLLCVEVNHDLAEILKLKRHGVCATRDFLGLNPDGYQRDRIVMNPPFEHFQDIEHVRYAFSLLKPGGRLVSVMSPGAFFRTDRMPTLFREWFDGLGGRVWDLPADSFQPATGVNARVVVLNKPAPMGAAQGRLF